MWLVPRPQVPDLEPWWSGAALRPAATVLALHLCPCEFPGFLTFKKAGSCRGFPFFALCFYGKRKIAGP